MHSEPSLLVLGLIALLVVFALLGAAAFLVFKSRHEGQTRLSAPAGCAVGCALVAIAGLAAAATLFVVALHLPAELMRNGPVKSIELQYERGPNDAPPPEAADAAPTGPAIRAKIALRAGVDPGSVVRVLRRRLPRGVDLTVREVERDGQVTSTIEIHAPLDEDARAELDDFLRDALDDPDAVDLPKGITIELRD